MLSLLVALSHAQIADATPTWIAWCDGQRATLVARVDRTGTLPAAGLPIQTEEHLAREVAGATFYRSDRPAAISYLRPFTAPVDNETGGTDRSAGLSALGDPDHRKVVLGACSVPGLLVSAPTKPAFATSTLALEVDGTWVGVELDRDHAGTRLRLTLVGSTRSQVDVELSHFGC